MSVLDCGGKPLDLSRPRVMGILNVTPDSFSDGGRYSDIDTALGQARHMVEEGAAIIDVGGESTRPGAAPVSADEERRRVIPVIEALAAELAVPVSIDTSKPELMREAVAAGAGLINDVMSLRGPGAMHAAVDCHVPVCLMHMLGRPRSMQFDPRYDDVLETVLGFLGDRVRACVAAGIPTERLLIDPGFGFGKTLSHNYAILRKLDLFLAVGVPLLVGVSRKSMIGAVLDKPVGERLYGSLAAAVIAVGAGASIVRVHDVGPTVDALAVAWAVGNR